MNPVNFTLDHPAKPDDDIQGSHCPARPGNPVMCSGILTEKTRNKIKKSSLRLAPAFQKQIRFLSDFLSEPLP